MRKDILLSQAMKVEPNKAILVNMLAKRIRQLYAGSRPLVEQKSNDDFEIVALREVVEGKLSYESEGLILDSTE